MIFLLAAKQVFLIGDAENYLRTRARPLCDGYAIATSIVHGNALNDVLDTNAVMSPAVGTIGSIHDCGGDEDGRLLVVSNSS